MLNFNVKKISPYIKLLLALALAAGGGYAFWFLANYFYPALTGSQTILMLQKNMAAETVNLGEFDGLLEKINKKTAPPPGQSATKNPF